MILVRCPAAFHEPRVVVAITQDAHERVSQSRFVVAGNENHAGIGDWRSGFGAGKRDDWKTTRNAGDGATSAAGDGPAYKKQYVGSAQEPLHVAFREHSRYRQCHGKIAQTFSKTGLRRICVTAKYQQR